MSVNRTAMRRLAYLVDDVDGIKSLLALSRKEAKLLKVLVEHRDKLTWDNWKRILYAHGWDMFEDILILNMARSFNET